LNIVDHQVFRCESNKRVQYIIVYDDDTVETGNGICEHLDSAVDMVEWVRENTFTPQGSVSSRIKKDDPLAFFDKFIKLHTGEGLQRVRGKVFPIDQRPQPSVEEPTVEEPTVEEPIEEEPINEEEEEDSA